MRLLRLALLLGAVVLAVAAEWVSYEPGDLALVVADGVVGLVLVTCGFVAWERRGESRVGPLMTSPATRGSRATSGRSSSTSTAGRSFTSTSRIRPAASGGGSRRSPSAAAYVDALVLSQSRENDVLTLVLAALVAAAALEGYLRASGTARRAGIPALAAALAFAGVLAFGAVERLAGWDADRAALWAYDIVIASLAVVLLVDLLRGRWAEAVVAGPRRRPRQARRHADPAGRARAGARRPLARPRLLAAGGGALRRRRRPSGRAPGAGRGEGGDADRARRTAGRRPRPRRGGAGGSGARRGRRLGRADGGRERPPSGGGAGAGPGARRLAPPDRRGRGRAEAPPRAGAQRRGRAAPGRGRRDPATRRGRRSDGPAARDVAETEDELRDGPRGAPRLRAGHPSQRADRRRPGRGAPGARLRAGLPVELEVSVGRLAPAVEAAVYFLCSEALANAAKHAQATTMTIDVTQSGGRLLVRDRRRRRRRARIRPRAPACAASPTASRRSGGRLSVESLPRRWHSAPRRDPDRLAGLVDPRPGLRTEVLRRDLLPRPGPA